MKLNIMAKLREYYRILIIAKKPEGREFSQVLKVTGGGMLIIGFIGFLLQVIFDLVKL